MPTDQPETAKTIVKEKPKPHIMKPSAGDGRDGPCAPLCHQRRINESERYGDHERRDCRQRAPCRKLFPGEVFKKMYQEPFRTTNTMSRFAVSIKVKGGGLSGQLGAVIHGISRALEKVDKEKFRPILKKRGFMMRDPRAKQRRKAGFAGKARARKQSPKR